MDLRTKARGQATTEMALGLLVFVTILVFGIHFAEVGYISLKVQEAAMSAVWETTAQKMHDPTGGLPSYHVGSSISAAAGNAQNRYQDFDGRTAATNSSTLTHVFTQGTNLDIACGQANILPMPNKVQQIYPDTGGEECSASAKVGPIANKFPREFVDTGPGAIFKKKNWAASISSIKVCGLGRATGNSSCDGKYFIYTDDWALLDGSEASTCFLSTGQCANSSLYNLVQRRYVQQGQAQTGAAVAMASAIVGSSPIDPNQFWISMPGEDEGFIDPNIPGGEGNPPPQSYHGSPGATVTYSSMYGGRAHCFLGFKSPPYCVN